MPGFGISEFSEEELDIICEDVESQNPKLRQEVENLFPEIKNDKRKTEEQVEKSYTDMYENIAKCLMKRKLVSPYELAEKLERLLVLFQYCINLIFRSSFF